MRTTINLDDDVAAAVDKLRRTSDLGLSEAVNELARRGLRAEDEPTHAVKLRTRPMGLKIDISNVEAALDEAEGPFRR